MTILSSLGMGSFRPLYTLVLAGAVGLCACNENLTASPDDMATVTPPPADGAVGEFTSVALSENMGGIKFDDAIYSTKLGKVIIPGAATGNLYFVDPDTMAVSSITGFAKPVATPGTVPKGGITSVNEGNGLLYATNQTDQKLYVVDPTTQSIVGSVALAGNPGYVRYVATTSELWVTEPDTQQQIEIFSLTDPRKPRHSTSMRVAGGPTGLYINNTAKVAYTNGEDLQTVTIDLRRRSVKSTWASGCVEPRNVLADEANGLAFVGCGEGGVVVVDLTAGKRVGELRNPNSADSFGFSPTLRHLYLPGSSLIIAGVAKNGTVTKLGEVATPGGTTQHALADDRGYAWDLKTDIGQLQRIADSYPASN